jgi:hypothetical protein
MSTEQELRLFIAETGKRLSDPMYDDVENRDGLAIDCEAIAGKKASLDYLKVEWQTERAIKAEDERDRLKAEKEELVRALENLLPVADETCKRWPNDDCFLVPTAEARSIRSMARWKLLNRSGTTMLRGWTYL